MSSSASQSPESNPQPQSGQSDPPDALPMSAAALEAMPFPLLIYTLDGLFVAANELTEQAFGLSRKAMLGTHNILTDPSAQRSELHGLFKAAAAGQRGQSVPIYYESSFPETRNPERVGCWLEITYLPFRNPDGRVTHVGLMYQDVSERVEAEQQNDFFSMLIENAKDGLGVVDMTGHFTYANKALHDMTKYGNELIGMSLSQLHEADVDIFNSAFGMVMEQGYWSGEITTHRADGSTFLTDVSTHLMRDSQGQPQGAGAILRDISERQTQQQRLKMFEALIHHAPDAIGVTSMDNQVVYANPASALLYGYGDDLLGLNGYQLYPQDLHTEVKVLVQDILQKGFWQGNFEQITKDGRRFPITASLFALRNEQDQPIGLGAIIRDISEQQQREEELSTFKSIVENALDGIAMTDLDGTILYHNSAYQNMNGSKQTLIGTNSHTLVLAEDLPKLQAATAELSENGFIHRQFRCRRNDGTLVPVDATVFAQKTPRREQRLIWFLRDISDLQRIEEERALFQQRIIEAQEMALRELSTPLIPIADGVVALPLIGTIDSNRAQMVVETLLNGVATMHAHTTIIDITGVSVVDTQVANVLLRTAQAIKLLGARVILTGIRPEVAQTLVGLGVELQGISTRNTLQSGIAEALRSH